MANGRSHGQKKGGAPGAPGLLLFVAVRPRSPGSLRGEVGPYDEIKCDVALAGGFD